VICISKEITERKHMEQDLQRLSTHDILTGLYNRNYFEVELARLQVSRQFPISIVIADMDNLKTVNDKYGHSAGDSLIRKVAQAMRQSFRAEDIIARIGGDEFIAILPMTREEVAESSITRLRAAIDRQADPLLRLSVGVSTGQDGSYLPDILRLADDHMYQDKKSHRLAIGSITGNEA
jgi:diguanylate cyclase (GGDEF)-like protein